MVGQTISHYKIIAKLGEGGMGEVFLAHDTLLDRKVALKFLPDFMQEDPVAQKRFLREAKSAAALDHPFICKIYETGEEEGKSFISMEYMQGTTLKDKLTEGALPLKEALEKATEIAEALEMAHKQGIVHRDLKPSNIMLTPDGHVKVMDFGLAKRLVPAEGVESQDQTLTASLTKTGATLGTLSYMSPEQLRGEGVDTRSDIFSFGVVLYEMLTGVHPFQKVQPMETGNAILNEAAAPLSEYMNRVPSLLQHTVRKMLAKEPERRYQHIGGTTRTQLPLWRRSIPWSITAVIAVIAGIAIWILKSPVPQPLLEFVISPPPTAPLRDSPNNELAISPDGRHIIYNAVGQNTNQLYLRSLDNVLATPISGTEGAKSPFFSPDGESVAFFASGKLKKVSLWGGSAITLCDAGAQGPYYGSWDSEGMIVFSASKGTLYRVSAAGDTPEMLASPDSDKGELGYYVPKILPGGKAVLFSVWRGLANYETAALLLETGEKKIVIEGGRQAHYSPTGHLVYGASGIEPLMAVPFDLERLEVTGESAPVLEGVRQTPLGMVDYTFSTDGTLAYVPAGKSIGRSLVWVDRQGTERLVTEEKRIFNAPRVSPDGKRLALAIIGDDGYLNVWIYDMEGDSFSRVTFGGQSHGRPIWTADGKSITFRSARGGIGNLYQKQADGSGPTERLTTSEYNQNPDSWSPDGSVLAFTEIHPKTEYDIWILSMDGDRKPELLISSPQRDCCARFSPDGKWLAYVSNETGRDHVYVTPYPEPTVKWLVSGEEGGGGPLWSPDGTEIFYRSGNQMMVVSVQTKPTFSSGKPRELFEGAYVTSTTLPGVSQYHDIHPAGQRLLMIKEDQSGGQINVVLNWFEKLKRLVPTD